MNPTKNKFSDFQKPTLSEWTKEATKELKGGDPWTKLSHKMEGYTILPIYDKSNSQNFDSELAGSKNNLVDAQTWYNCSHIYVENEELSNKEALFELENGADGIFFVIDREVTFEVLLNDIEWPFCSLSFMVKKDYPNIAQSLNDFIAKKNWQNQSLSGAYFSNFHRGKFNHPSFKWSGVEWKEKTNPVEEIVNGIQAITSLQSSNQELASFAISLNLSQDFFLSITKIRAIRIVWTRFLKIHNHPKIVPLFIHGYSQAWKNAEYGPQENMLKGTTVALSAILGGCDAMTIYSEDDSSLAKRMSRNISNILRFESHCNKVSDPVAGSFFIENLTQQLANEAWKIIEPKLPL